MREEAACAQGALTEEPMCPCVPVQANVFAGSTPGQVRRRVDPRVSLVVLLALNVFSFLSPSVPLEIAGVALDAVLMVWCGRGRLAVGWLVGYVAVVLVTLACAAVPFLMPVGACFMMFRRLMPTAMFAAAMISTTYVGEMACALQAVGLPGRMTVAVCVALRFFPTAAREARAVREAMLTRGVRLTPKAIVSHPKLLLESFMVPFIHRISIVADELGDAVMVRGIEAPVKRTCYHELRLRALDVLVIVATGVLLAGAICGKVL